jgi:hypothetical protein
MNNDHPCSRAQDWLAAHAEEVVQYLLSNAKKQGRNYVVGSVRGEEGQSLHITVDGPAAGQWKDFGTNEKGNISGLWRAVHSIAKDDYKTFFEQVEAFSGQSFGYSPKGAPPDWPRCLADWTSADADKLIRLRGYSREFVDDLHRLGQVGTQFGMIVFPVWSPGGVLTGLHRYHEKERKLKFSKGTKVALLVLGDLLDVTEVHIHESRWDLYAHASVSGSYKQPGIRFLSTCGAGNAKLLKGQIPAGTRVYIWKQHDLPKNGNRPANDVWAEEVTRIVGREVFKVEIPPQHKDINDWTRAGAAKSDINAAVSAARPFNFKPLVDSQTPIHSHSPIPAWIEGAIAKVGVYFEPHGQHYWIKDARSVWIPLTITDLRLRFKDLGYSSGAKDDLISKIDSIIIVIQNNRAVDYVDSLAGYQTGIYELYGKRILVKDSPALIRPTTGDFPNINKLLTGMFGQQQLKFLYGWLKIALESLYDQQFRTGQVIAMAGPRDCGKSLFQNNILTPMFGGRSAKPYRYMAGLTPFNGDLFCSEHLMIEDEQPSTDLRARRNFGTKIKEFAANISQSCHHKFHGALTLPPFWRATISLNDEPENLMILPPLDESIADKISIFKIAKNPMPMPTATLKDRQKFTDAIAKELPYFINYLLNDWTIEAELVSHRFGIKEFHHPEILFQLGALAPENRLLELIRESDLFVENTYINNQRMTSVKREWFGSATQLENELTKQGSPVREAAKTLFHFSTAAGIYLGRLATLYPNLIKFKRSKSTRTWILRNNGILRRKYISTTFQ